MWREEDEQEGIVGELGGLGWTFREDKAHISLILTSFISLVLLD